MACSASAVALLGAADAPQALTLIPLGDTTWIVFFIMRTSGIQMHHYLLDQSI